MVNTSTRRLHFQPKISLRQKYTNNPELYHYVKWVGVEEPWEFTASGFRAWAGFALLHRVRMYVSHLTARSAQHYARTAI